MKKKFIFSIAAFVFAVTVIFGFAMPNRDTKQPIQKEMKTEAPAVDFYYRFDGSPGDEDQMSEWTQITLAEYNAPTCASGSNSGCKIKNTTNSSGHPTSVPLTTGGTQVPRVDGTINTEVKNKL